jgi:hypothetical protein
MIPRFKKFDLHLFWLRLLFSSGVLGFYCQINQAFSTLENTKAIFNRMPNLTSMLLTKFKEN